MIAAEILIAIAQLCSASGNPGIWENNHRAQLQCQQYYVRCLKESGRYTPTGSDLAECILRKS